MKLRYYLILFAITIWPLRILGNDIILPQEDGKLEAVEDSQQVSQGSDEQQLSQGYHHDATRQAGTQLDVVTDLDNSFPQSGSVFGPIIPQIWSKWKQDIYDESGVKVSLSYQTLYQKATESRTGNDSAFGGWLLAEFEWTAFNQGEDWEGSLVASFDVRHTINSGQNSAPGLFKFDIGSLWLTDGLYFDWSYPAIFFWEQWGKKDRFMMRFGQQSATSVIDFFRFGDLRTSFTSAQQLSVSILPSPPPGLGVSFKWWPLDEDSELYVVGTVNDINAPPGKVDWSGLLDEGEVFTGLEIGTNWRRGKEDFDHAHLLFWHADEVSTAGFPSKAGWGFKLAGSKQWNKIVAYGNYAYNTAEGGGFGFTNSEHGVNAGIAYTKPFGIKGETALGGSWAQPIDTGLRDQYGLEAYWKILLLPNLWVTPGVQVIFDPTFNTAEDSIVIGQIKARIIF